jgi:DNA-binding CsgD family transcriptional regulator
MEHAELNDRHLSDSGLFLIQPTLDHVQTYAPRAGACAPGGYNLEWSDIAHQDWLECWGDLDHRARMVVTMDRTFVAGDCRAEEALAARHDLRLENGRVATVNPAGASELEALLCVSGAETRTICIPRRQRSGHVLMRAARLGSMHEKTVLGITFWVADDRFAVEWPDFRPIFGLTAAEAKVVEKLIHGVSAEDIGRALKVSINTVRSHISHVYEKLGITCREQLWRRLAPYRIN